MFGFLHVQQPIKSLKLKKIIKNSEKKIRNFVGKI